MHLPIACIIVFDILRLPHWKQLGTHLCWQPAACLLFYPGQSLVPARGYRLLLCYDLLRTKVLRYAQSLGIEKAAGGMESLFVGVFRVWIRAHDVPPGSFVLYELLVGERM